MKKRLVIMAGLAAWSAYAGTTNTFTRAGNDNSWNTAANWDAVPADWSNYSANLVFGRGNGSSYVSVNNTTNTKLGSIKITAAAAGSWSFLNNGYQFTTGDQGDVIVNDSSYPVSLMASVFNTGPSAGLRYVRANSGDILFRNCSLYVSTEAIPNLCFRAGNGHKITFETGKTIVCGVGAARTVMMQGDGAGGTVEINSAISNTLNIIAQDAVLVVLNMDSGAAPSQVGNLVLETAGVSFKKDNLCNGGVTFGRGNGGENKLSFNGRSNTFTTLTVTGAAANRNVLDFSGGDSAVVFADCSAQPWLNGLVITGFERGRDTLRFGTNANGLTAQQLRLITVRGFENFIVGLDAKGFLTLTEPLTVGAHFTSGAKILCLNR